MKIIIFTCLYKFTSQTFFTNTFLFVLYYFTVVKAVEAIRPIVIGRKISSIFNKFGEFWTEVVQDGQLRWVS